VDWAVDIPLSKQSVNLLHVLILAGVGEANDSTNTDGVLVDEVDGFFRVDDISLVGAVDVLLLDVKVPGGFLPADLDSTVHDDVGLVVWLACGLALVLPSLLHGQRTQHDSFRGANAGCAHGILILVSRLWAVVEACNHVDTSVLDFGGLRVLLVVDEVFGQGLLHELLRLIFHVGGDETC